MDYSFRGLLSDFKTIWLGDDKHFEEQVVSLKYAGEPISYGDSDAKKISAVNTSVKILADQGSRLLIDIYEPSDKGRVIAKDDPRQKLLTVSPDGMINSQVWKSTMITSLYYKGNAFSVIHRTAMDEYTAIEYLPFSWVSRPIFEGGAWYYPIKRRKYDRQGKVYWEQDKINAENMIHYRIHSDSTHWGTSPIAANELNLSTLFKSKKTADAYWTNSAKSHLFLQNEIPDAAAQDLFENAVRSFKKRSKQISNAGETEILPPWAKIQEIKMNFIDEQFLASTKYDAAQVAAWYGIPGHWLGLDATRFNNVEQENLNFISKTMASLSNMMEAELNFKLLTDVDRKKGKSVSINTNILIQTDIKTKLAYYTGLFNMGVLNGDQIATAEGLPTYDGGETHFIPGNNLIPVEDAGASLPDSEIQQ